MHQDKFRSAPPSKVYKDNHNDIFGPPTGAPKLTKAERDKQELDRKAKHAQDALDGKKDAQWYLDNEQRVSQDPEYQKKPGLSRDYNNGYARIFGDRKT